MATATNQAQPLSREQKRDLRRNMANAVKEGAPVAVVAKTWGYTIRSVQLACHEFGVPLPDKDLSDQVVNASRTKGPARKRRVAR